jgi:hypothetical protein
MRALALLLVLGNLMLAAWFQFYGTADAEPVPLGKGLNSERLQVIRAGALPAAKVAPRAIAKCIEWGSFAVADAPRAEKALEPLALGARLAQRRTEETAGWWVFIPPQGSRPAALKKAGELKGLGIDEYFIVQEEGPHHWAVSLGVFRTEEAAQARLATLQKRGVRSAQVGPREMLVPKIWLQVKGVDESLESKLREIAREIEGSEVKPCS